MIKVFYSVKKGYSDLVSGISAGEGKTPTFLQCSTILSIWKTQLIFLYLKSFKSYEKSWSNMYIEKLIIVIENQIYKLANSHCWTA